MLSFHFTVDKLLTAFPGNVPVQGNFTSFQDCRLTSWQKPPVVIPWYLKTIIQQDNCHGRGLKDTFKNVIN